MSADPINANPIVLSHSDLPTRRQTHVSSSKGQAGSMLFRFNSPTQWTDPLINPPASSDLDSEEDEIAEPIDEQEIYDLISTISDPEHPLSLGSLAVVNLPDIFLTPPPTPRSPFTTVLVLITPTITHCSLATVIGLGVRVRLEQSLPPRFRVDVRIKDGTHSTGDQVNKQLADKERVAAALENATLMGVLNKMLETCR
ncbi:MAG: hypothetical protein M1829_001079 [Trizodia sp. TS-e1964]|nr:MAG: hypothetical protein M1829_001079 [Trizodia sp. TS-e1964]